MEAGYETKIGVKSAPSISKPFVLCCYFNFYDFSTKFFKLWTIESYFASFYGLYLITSKSGWIKLQLFAIFSAVYILSPVNIQTFISKYQIFYLLEVSLL